MSPLLWRLEDMEKYRVAIVSDWYYPKIGGIEYSIDALARALSRRGHEVHIITRRYPGDTEYMSREGVRVRRVGRPSEGRFLRPQAYIEFYRILKEGSYDVVHAHGLDSPLSLLSLLVCKRLRIPAVMTNHSLIGRTPLRPFLLLAGRILLRNADAVIAVSSAVAEECRIMSRREVYVIPNGIEVESSCSARLPFSKDGKIVITTVSRLTHKKRVEDIVDIAPSLLKKRRDIIFLVIGDGPLRKKIEKKVRRLNLSHSFYFTGRIPREKVLCLLEHSDIFVLPSKDEAFGVAVLEALSKGVAVVARNHSGVSDIVTHNKTGLLASNKYELARYIEELIERPALRERFSSAAIKELYRYDWNEIARRVEGVYSGVIHAENFNHRGC